MRNIDFLSFIENTNRASSNKELFDFLKKILLEVGYDQVTYNLLTDHNSYGIKARHGVIKECPVDWYNYYFENGYQHIDPRVSVGLKQKKAFLWKDVNQHIELNLSQKKLVSELEDMHLHNGIVVPIISVLHEISGVTMSRSCKDIDVGIDQLSLIQAIINQFHMCYLVINENKKRKSGSQQSLTPKEKEVLQWCVHGKSNWDISVILSISENGVEYHLRNIYRKLGVNNRVSAVINGIKSGHVTF